MGTGIVEYNENFCGSIERNVYPTCMEAATISYTVGYIHILPNAGIIIVSCVLYVSNKSNYIATYVANYPQSLRYYFAYELYVYS